MVGSISCFILMLLRPFVLSDLQRFEAMMALDPLRSVDSIVGDYLFWFFGETPLYTFQIYPLFVYFFWPYFHRFWAVGYLVVDFLMVTICVLIAIAYSTLLERKVMASMQRRAGPNVVGVWGLLQPLADGLKLLIKEPILPRKANKFLFIFSPAWVLFLSLFAWWFVPFDDAWSFFDFDLNLLYLIVLGTFEIYGILFAGWSSNSKYALLGGLRSAAQMISYELTLSFIYLIVVFITGSLNLIDIVRYQEHCWLVFPLAPIAIIFYIAMLAETNRTPFDLPEAEAELVAGYNVEYSGMLFAFFFLGEYSNMLFLNTLCALLFFGGWTFFGVASASVLFGAVILAIKITLLLFGFIWIRATLPRYRYDQLMTVGWKIFLPFVFCYFFGLVVFFFLIGGLPLFYDVYAFLVWPVLML